MSQTPATYDVDPVEVPALAAAPLTREVDAWIAEHNPDLAASMTVLEAAGVASTDLVPSGPGTALMPAPALDGEWITAAARTEVLIQEMHSIIRQEIECRVRTGDILAELRELCCDAQGHLTDRWDAVLERCGVTHDTAKKRIYVARAVRLLPALRDLAEKSWTKALTLIEGTDPVMLADIAQGDADLTLDEVDRMTVVVLKKELRRAKHDTALVVAEETKTLRSEVEGLREDLAASRAMHDADVREARKTARALRESVQTLAETADRLLDQLAPLEPGDLQRLRLDLDSCVSAGSLRLKDLWTTVQERLLDLGLEA